MTKLLRGIGGRITLELRDPNENLIAADAPVTLTIVNGAGAELVTNAVAASGAVGIYHYDVPAAAAAQLDRLTSTWSATVGGDAKTYTLEHEVVGAFLCSRQQIRRIDSEFDDTAKYPTPLVDEARTRAETLFEDEIGLALRPKGTRVVVSGSGEVLQLLELAGGAPLFNPTRLISLSIDAGGGLQPLTQDELDAITLYRWGALRRALPWPTGVHNIRIHLEYGLATPPPTVSAEVAKLAAHYLKPSAVPDRAISVSSTEDTFRLVTAEREAPTGIPSVDAVINALRVELPAIG